MYLLSTLCETEKPINEYIALAQHFGSLPHAELIVMAQQLQLDTSALVAHNHGTFRMDEPKYISCLAMILAAKSIDLPAIK